MAFIVENWVDLALIIVGASAFITYFLQGRREKIDAASVLVLQIDELLEKIGEMSSYIVEGQLNNTAFYESLATVYKGNIIKNLIMDCQSYTKYRPNETTGGIFVSWRRKEELPTGA